jgi:hypothetical protein
VLTLTELARTLSSPMAPRPSTTTRLLLLSLAVPVSILETITTPRPVVGPFTPSSGSGFSSFTREVADVAIFQCIPLMPPTSSTLERALTDTMRLEALDIPPSEVS